MKIVADRCRIVPDRPLMRVPQGILQKSSRFYAVRRGYSLMQNTIQNFNERIGRQKSIVWEKSSLFDELCVEDAVREMQQRSVAFGLSLSSEMTHEIYRYAIDNLCFEPEHPETFKIDDLNDGYLNNKRPVFRALVSDLTSCHAIQTITQDPILLQIAYNYLGYYPTLITQHLTWSIASSFPLAKTKEYYPPTTFHYDIAGYNFVTVYFYITDVDDEAGSHVMIGNSHRHKPLFLLLSNSHCDEKIYDYYGRDREIVIIGKAGFGFFQDPSCFHKVIPPVTQNRLLFQIRFS